MNPLDEYKKSSVENFNLGTHIVKIKTLSYNETKFIEEAKNAIDSKIRTLAKAIISVDNVELKDFDSVIQSQKENKLTIEQSICQEIGSWDSNAIEVLYGFFVALTYRHRKEKAVNKNLSENPQLRIYWKLRKIFSKEEIDSWDSEDWNWAFDNLREDRKEQLDLIKDVIDYIKPYLNMDLYKWENKKEKENKARKAADNKVVQKYNTDKVEFEIDNSVGGDVFSDEIPIIMEQ